jgi:hypothetical protein
MLDQELIAKILKEHSSTFEALARQEEIDKMLLSQNERDALYHFLTNREEIKAEIDASHNKQAHLFPPAFYDIYLENFKKNGLKIITNHISSFNLSPESIYGTINEENINNILGQDFLRPPREK